MRTQVALSAALSFLLVACGGDGGDEGNADAEADTEASAEDEHMDSEVATLQGAEAEHDMIATESGLRYQVVREGDGDSPQLGQNVVLHYRGTLPDGTEFDSSYGGEPAEFAVDDLIAGFSETLQLMRPGGHVRVWIPSELGYGEQGAGGLIGPNQDLVFEIELLEVR